MTDNASSPSATIDQFRQHLSQRLRPHWQEGHLEGDFAVAGVAPERGPLRPAAVLVPLVQRPEGFSIILTRRTEHLLHHAGQISFPGGRTEADDPSPVATALREAEEEIGLDPSRVEVLGFLARYQTVTGFLVNPVVGLVHPPFELHPDPGEVAEVFELPLAFVLDPHNHQRHSRTHQGQTRHFYVLPYQDYYIWGATAAMLVSLYRLLQSSDSPQDLQVTSAP